MTKFEKAIQNLLKSHAHDDEFQKDLAQLINKYMSCVQCPFDDDCETILSINKCELTMYLHGKDEY